MAVGAESVGDRGEVPGPRHEVREEEVLDPVEQLGVGDLRRSRGRCARARRRARRSPSVWRAVDPGSTVDLGRARAERRADDLGVVDLVVEVLAADADRVDHPADVAPVDVVLGQGVGRRREQLRVHRHRVVRLDECLERDLPVARHDPHDVRGEVALLERPLGEVPRQVLEVLHERRGLRDRRSRRRSRPRSRPALPGGRSLVGSTCGKSHAHGISRRVPSRFQVNPWNGQRKPVDPARSRCGAACRGAGTSCGTRGSRRARCARR